MNRNVPYNYHPLWTVSLWEVILTKRGLRAIPSDLAKPYRAVSRGMFVRAGSSLRSAP